MERILASIDYLEPRAAALSKELDVLEEEMRRVDRNVFRGVYGGYWPYWRMAAEWERLLVARDDLVGRLLFVLDNMIRDYRNGLSVAERHPDLQHHVSTLEKGLESAENKHREVRLRRY
jgi:hypothetical protein